MKQIAFDDLKKNLGSDTIELSGFFQSRAVPEIFGRYVDIKHRDGAVTMTRRISFRRMFSMSNMWGRCSGGPIRFAALLET